MLRDLVLVACLLVCLGLTVRHPFAGVLTWTWIALMQPHHEQFGYISNVLRINLLVSVVTILSWLLSKERKLPHRDALIGAVWIFFAWMTFNELFAVNPGDSWLMWDRVWRI